MRVLKITYKLIKRYGKPLAGMRGMLRGLINYYKNKRDSNLSAYISWYVYYYITGEEPLDE